MDGFDHIDEFEMKITYLFSFSFDLFSYVEVHSTWSCIDMNFVERSFFVAFSLFTVKHIY